MEPRDSHKGSSAWTMIEVVMVTVSLAILFPLLAGAVANARQKADRVTIAAEPETLHFAGALWSQDHGGKYSTEAFAVSGAMGSMDAIEAWRTFQVLPSQSALPQLPICPLNDSDWAGRIRETALGTNFPAVP